MKAFILECLLSSAIAMSCNGQTKVSPMFDCSENLEMPYGVCSHLTRTGSQYDYEFYSEAIKSMKSLGVDYTRIDLDCSNITPIESTSKPARYDSIYQMLHDNNIAVDGLLSHLQYNIKCWEDYSSYWRYVDTLANRYGKYSGCFEILNEVDRYADRNITYKYVELLKKTYYRIKKRDPQQIVLFTGISWSKAGLLNYAMKLGAYNYFDIMNFHVYDTPENLPSHFEDIRTNMDKYGWSKPVWITECGYSTEEDKEVAKLKEERQAKYLPRIFLISFAYGIDKVFWYTYRSPENDFINKEDNYGIVHKDLTPKPAYNSYKTLIKMCPNRSSRPTLVIKDNVYICTWQRPDYKKVTAIWTSGESFKYKLDKTKNVKIYNYLGSKLKVYRILNITDKVIYILTE